MSTRTSIEWTDVTWNPTTGCDWKSPGCDRCFALKMAKRLKAMGSAKYQNDGDPRTSGPGFGVTIHEDVLAEPFRWRKPRRVFVNSMSDLFHARVPRHFVARVFEVMAATPQHTYQVLTKRPERMRRLVGEPGDGGVELLEAAEAAGFPKTAQALYEAPWPLPNVWLGTSIESAEHTKRIDAIRATSASVRFISAEPLLGSLDLSDHLALRRPVTDPELDAPDGALVDGMERVGDCWERRSGIDWVIVGGESGPGARPMHPAWARGLRDQCQAAGVAFFFKQWGAWAPEGVGRARRSGADPRGGAAMDGQFYPPTETAPPGAVAMQRYGKKRAGRTLDGREWLEFPRTVQP